MIVNRFQEVAERNGINTAYQFQKISGFSPAMAARIYKAKWQRLDLKTLNTLCNLFNCTPNDILEFSPDENEE